MKRQSAIGLALLALGFGGPCLGAEGQKAVVIHAGQLFDGKSDRLLSNQVIVNQGERIVAVGPAGSVSIPAGAEDIDLSTGTVLPGLIDTHVHIGAHFGKDGRASTPGETPAEQALAAAGNAYSAWSGASRKPSPTACRPGEHPAPGSGGFPGPASWSARPADSAIASDASARAAP